MASAARSPCVAHATGANVVITGKTVEAHPWLPGTIHTVAEEVIAAGGQALAIQLDVRDEQAIHDAVEQAAAHFGGIDVLVNNASAIGLTPTLQTPAKRLDLMWDVNMRATFLASQACIPHLKKAANPHILTLSPPLNLEAKWFAPHIAYTMSKFGMSMCMLGMAHEFADDGIACNCLWPKTTIATSAIEFNFPEDDPARFAQTRHRGRCGACHIAARQQDLQRPFLYRRGSAARLRRERF